MRLHSRARLDAVLVIAPSSTKNSGYQELDVPVPSLISVVPCGDGSDPQCADVKRGHRHHETLLTGSAMADRARARYVAGFPRSWICRQTRMPTRAPGMNAAPRLRWRFARWRLWATSLPVHSVRIGHKPDRRYARVTRSLALLVTESTSLIFGVGV
jgi:hypothetical protein